MSTDRHVSWIRLIALFNRVLVQRRIVVPFQMARAGEPLVARGAVVGLWSPRLVTFPRLIGYRRRLGRLLQKTSGYLMAWHRLRARNDRRTWMSRRFNGHVLPAHELTLIWERRNTVHVAHWR